MQMETLTDRERSILEAVIRNYVHDASPVGSRTLSRHSGLNLSAASIRNTMSDLEEKGYLQQPHTSAGRVPTDKAYRLYVDRMMHKLELPSSLMSDFIPGRSEDAQLENLLQHTARALGVLTRELGLGIVPLVSDGILEKIDLIEVSSNRMLVVLTIQHGMIKTIFVEVEAAPDRDTMDRIASRLNERLSGLTFSEVRATAEDRLADVLEGDDDPLNIFIQSADRVFDMNSSGELYMSETSSLASQPEFKHESSLRSLLELTDRRGDILELMRGRAGQEGLKISIGSENEMSELSNFTVITDTYRVGKMRGIIGVIGPTRMSYDKVVSVVEYTSRLLSGMLKGKVV